MFEMQSKMPFVPFKSKILDFICLYDCETRNEDTELYSGKCRPQHMLTVVSDRHCSSRRDEQLC